MKTFIIKSILFISIIISIVALIDYIGFFKQGTSDNHAEKKWNAYYGLSKQINFDVLMVGNSHLYTGINPETFSNILGVNSFILASPGTSVAEIYFSLKEALTISKPKIVVLETFCIDQTISKKSTGAELSDLYKSFDARKSLIQKLISTPYLFKIDNYPFAWSSMVRNHSFIFNNKDLINENIDKFNNREKLKKEEQKDLYLGRYVRFNKGLQEDVLLKYKSNGAPIDGEKIAISDESIEYTKKISDLCKENKIQLVLLTLPMYEKHIKNYSAWKNTLKEKISSVNAPWIDLQEADNYKGFAEDCFENTYNFNQHMTFQGSLVASYKLASFIEDQFPGFLPFRKNEPDWFRMFYGRYGYFENNSPAPNDPNNFTIMKMAKFDSLKVIAVEYLTENDPATMLVKVKRESLPKVDLNNTELMMTMDVNFTKSTKEFIIPIPKHPHHLTPYYILYQTNIKRVNIKEIKNIKVRIK
ncbi:MAG: hypothetical protein WCK02_10440 [Bacteroidota bacterium]